MKSTRLNNLDNLENRLNKLDSEEHYLNDVKGYLVAGLLEQFIIYSNQKEKLLKALDELEA